MNHRIHHIFPPPGERLPASMNGRQLSGLRRALADLRMGFHPRLRWLGPRKKWALWDVARRSKLTELGGRIYSNTFTPPFPSPAYDRYLEGVLAIASGRPWPVITNFAVTPHCPCSCRHCSFAHRVPEELPLARLKEAIGEVQELGTSVIGLTGGEPLLRTDLEEIVAAVGDRSMSLVFTTGWQLTRERVRALREAGLGVPVVSLDHWRPEVHDARRGVEGIHAGAVRAIELFREEGFYVAVSFVPDRALLRDRTELERTLAFIRDLGVNDMRLTSPILSGQLTARHDWLLTPEDVGVVFEIQERLTKTRGEPGCFAYDYFESEQIYGCGAGYNYMFVDAGGNVCPCDFTMISFGNIKERPIAEIWGETSRRFAAPGLACYANVISDTIAAEPSPLRPLSPEASHGVVDRHPPFDPDRPPGFHRNMGMAPKRRS